MVSTAAPMCLLASKGGTTPTTSGTGDCKKSDSEDGSSGMKTPSHWNGSSRLMSAVPMADTSPRSSPTITSVVSSSSTLRQRMITSADSREKSTAVVQCCSGTCRARQERRKRRVSRACRCTL